MKKCDVSMDDARLSWACRRGMLELDLLLEPYAREVYPSLAESDKIAFWHLLECADQDLFDWLLDKRKPTSPEIGKVVKMVQAYARKMGRTQTLD